MNYRFIAVTCAGALLFSLVGCQGNPRQQPDHPRLSPDVAFQDITFHSTALNRDMQYRVILPKASKPQRRLRVVYLLHGGGGGFRDWSNYSDVAQFSEPDLLLVMPEGASSYYVNAVDPSQDRYEDYIVHDLIADVEDRFPVSASRESRAIVGVSMGGFGAVNLAIHHPELFIFAGGLSPAIDVPRRAFTIKRFGQSRRFNSIFGPSGSNSRRENDPFVQVRAATSDGFPFLFLTCGEQEGLLAPNRQFASLLSDRKFAFEFHTMRGSHDWNQWNAWLPTLFTSLRAHLGAS